MAEKIGQVFRNSTKKNQLFIYDGSRVIDLLMQPCNLAFFQKGWHGSGTMTDVCWQKDVQDPGFGVESKCEVKMRPLHLKKQRRRRFPVFPEVPSF
jgi:hypothetical protein